MTDKRWIVSSGDKQLAVEAAAELDIDANAAYIATSRGIIDFEELDEFFDKFAPLTLHPLSIKDMDKAAVRIRTAIDNFERICVWGDYDCDGVTSTAVLYTYLQNKGANAVYHIPDRLSEGYGLNKENILLQSQTGTKLIVTVDNGVSCKEEIEYAKSLGLDVIVTDHHTTPAEMPICHAVCDPHRPDCQSEFKEMSGVGVAFKLICAVEGGNDEALLEEYADLIAIGTIGDIVSLTGENRVMVRKGVSKIRENARHGIKALFDCAGSDVSQASASTIAFVVCPRINAAGRMENADKAFELLMADNEDRALSLAEEVNMLNRKRQQTETEIFKCAVDTVYENKTDRDNVIVVAGDNWHLGVIGIVASKLVDFFGKPSIVISKRENFCKASGRSVEGFSLYEALNYSKETLIAFGGHKQAAGLSLYADKIDEFRKKINECAALTEIPIPVRRIDCKIMPSSVKLSLLESISELEPCGAANPTPIFGLFKVIITDIYPVSEGKHTKITVSRNGVAVSCIYFGMPSARFPFEKGDMVDLAVELDKNMFNGEIRVSVMVRDIKYSSLNQEKIFEAIKAHNKLIKNGSSLTNEEKSLLLPDRVSQINVFKSIKEMPLKDGYCQCLCQRFNDDGENLGKYMTVVDMMTEMGLMQKDENNVVFVVENTTKVDLNNSNVIKKLKE